MYVTRCGPETLADLAPGPADPTLPRGLLIPRIPRPTASRFSEPAGGDLIGLGEGCGAMVHFLGRDPGVGWMTTISAPSPGEPRALLREEASGYQFISTPRPGSADFQMWVTSTLGMTQG